MRLKKGDQLDDFCRNSQAYSALISNSCDIINVPAVDANRMYTLIDYTTLSSRKGAAVWPTPPRPESLWSETTLQPA